MSWRRRSVSHSVLEMAMTLSPSGKTVSGRIGLGPVVADEHEQRAAIGQVDVRWAPAEGRRVAGDLGLDELQLAALQLGQVEQLVDGDVLLDGAPAPCASG